MPNASLMIIENAERLGLSQLHQLRGRVENNMKFHLKLISYSGNDYCYHMVESSTGVLTRAYAQRFWDQRDNRSWNVDVEGHLCIIRCMEEGRFDQAEQALKKDIASFLDIICPNYARTFNL